MIIPLAPTKESKHVIVPVGFDPPDNEFRDRLLLLAESFVRVTSIYEEYQRGDYIRRSREWWHKHCSKRKYKSIQNQAIDLGLLDPPSPHSKGHHSRGFRLSDEYRNANVYVAKLSVGRVVASKSDIDRLDPISRYLAGKFNEFELGNAEQYPSYAQAASTVRLRIGFLYGGRDEFGGRFHSNYTSLSRTVRKHLVSNEPLVEIDVRECQPLLLGLLAMSPHRGGPGGLGSSLSAIDVREWVALCQSGNLYKEIGREIGKSRDEVKEAYCRAVYGSSWSASRLPIWKWIARRFPNVAAFAKRVKAESTLKVDPYRALARLLQRVESELMIDGVISRIQKEAPELQFLTVHDAIICPVSSAEYVASTIRSVFCERFGVKPGLRFKFLG